MSGRLEYKRGIIMPNEFHEYTNREERAAAIKLIEENGLTIKHDSFTLKNNKGNHLMGTYKVEVFLLWLKESPY